MITVECPDCGREELRPEDRRTLGWPRDLVVSALCPDCEAEAERALDDYRADEARWMEGRTA